MSKQIHTDPAHARNGHACAAIMRKGGAHGQTVKARRNQDKRQLRKAMREGSNSSPFYCLLSAVLRAL